MIIAGIVSCQAEVRDGEKKGRAHFQALKHLELLARDWFKSAAWLGAVCQFPQTASQSRDSPADSDHSTTPGAERSHNQST
jgi:hypothetical protein